MAEVLEREASGQAQATLDPSAMAWAPMSIPEGDVQSPEIQNGILDTSLLKMMPVATLPKPFNNLPKWEDQSQDVKDRWNKKSSLDKAATEFFVRGAMEFDRLATGALQSIHSVEHQLGILSDTDYKTIQQSMPLHTEAATQEMFSRMPPEISSSTAGTVGGVTGSAAPLVGAGVAGGMLARTALKGAGVAIPAGGAGGMAARYGGGAAAGGVGGATAYVDPAAPQGQRALNTLGGTALGTVLPLAGSAITSLYTLPTLGTVVPAIRRALTKWDEILNQGGYAPFKDATKEGIALDAKYAAKLDSFQMSGHPTAEAMRNEAMILYPQQARIKRQLQLEKFSDDIKNTMDDLANASSKDYAGLKVGMKIKETVSKLKEFRNGAFNEQLDAAEKLVKGQPFIPINNLKDFLSGEREVLSQIVDVTQAQGASRALNTVMAGMNKAVVGNKMTVTEYKDLFKLVNGQLDKSSGYERVILNRAKTAIVDTLQMAKQDLTPSQQTAVDLLTSARSTYGRDSDSINQLALGPMRSFLRNRTPAAGEKILGTITSMPPSDVRNLVGTLDEFHPATVNLLRRQVLDAAFTKGQRVGLEAGGLPGEMRFNLDAFVKALPQGEKFDAFFGGSVSKQNVLDHVERAQRLRLFPDAASLSAVEAKQRVAQIGANLAQGKFKEQSMWISGLLAKYIDGPTYMKLLWDADAITAMKTVERAFLNPSDAALKAATPALGYLISSSTAARASEVVQTQKDNNITIPATAPPGR